METKLPLPPDWRGRVAALLDDPVGQAVLRSDGLSRDEVLRTLERVAQTRRDAPKRRGEGPTAGRSVELVLRFRVDLPDGRPGDRPRMRLAGASLGS